MCCKASFFSWIPQAFSAPARNSSALYSGSASEYAKTMSSALPVLSRFDESESVAHATCVTCPKLCRHACPVAEAEARETTSPHALMVLSALFKDERATAHSVGAFPYHCSNCGACTEVCLHDVDVPFWLSLSRHRVMKKGLQPEAVREVCGHFGVAGTPQGISLVEPLRALAETAGESFSRSGEVVYFPGCSTISDMPEAVTGLLHTSSILGLPKLDLLSESASCCGLPLLWAGEVEGYRAHATRFAAQFDGVRQLVVHEPSCAEALISRLPALGIHFAPEVIPVPKFLRENLRAEAVRERPEADSSARIAYVDGCSLARGVDQVESPRALLEILLGHKAVEVDAEIGKRMDCCGAGGLLPLVAPTTARLMAEEKIRAFRDSGATQLASFSPRCAAHLKSVDPSVDIVAVSTLLERA